MMLGLGSDVVNIDRIARTLERFGDRFLQRSFTKKEIAGYQLITNTERKAAYIARRFAAKEACAKALGTGFRHGLLFKNIGVVNDAQGKPSLELSGRAVELLQQLAGNNPHRIDITLSDDNPVAMAVVIISA